MALITDLPPELFVYLADFLTKVDILNIILTCRHFHQNYVALLWKEVSVKSEGKRPTLNINTLRAHAEWVHSLKYTGVLPDEYFDISFPNLRSIAKIDENKGHDITQLLTRTPEAATALVASQTLIAAKQDVCWARLVEGNPSIEDITLEAGTGKLELKEFWKAVGTSLDSPKRLCIKGLDSPDPFVEAAKIFWAVASRFEAFVCRSRYQVLACSSTTAQGEQTTSRVKKISFIALNFGTKFPGQQLAFFIRFHNLTAIVWRLCMGDIPTSRLARCLEWKLWPSLEHLDVYGIVATDEVMATVIRHLPPLKHLSIGSGDFGPLSFQHLRERLFGSVKILALSGCDKFTSSMALEVLSSCHQLEDFEAPFVYIRDLRATHQPWVCRGMRRLKVIFIDDENDSGYSGNDEPGAVDGVRKNSSLLVFEHLSTLHQLEVLDISPRNIWFRSDPSTNKPKGPQFRLDLGLGLLATLTQLKGLCLDHTKQDLRKGDVEWMLNQWPRLRKFSGQLSLSLDSTTEAELVGLVKERGVSRRYFFGL
ncbi:hypothetical protein EC991_001265 [Linnemannia zychae]|nr:hypothetical protein EC991_001265 [Linnemannia zychae]